VAVGDASIMSHFPAATLPPGRSVNASLRSIMRWPGAAVSIPVFSLWNMFLPSPVAGCRSALELSASATR